MNTKKLLAVFLTLLILMSLLCGCSAVVIDTERYQIIQKGEQYYFTFKSIDFLRGTHFDDNNWVTLKSVDELYSKLRNGSFSDEEYSYIRQGQVTWESEKVFDPNNLAEPVCPAPFSTYTNLSWGGEIIAFYLMNNDYRCDFIMQPEHNFESFLNYMANYPDSQYDPQKYEITIEHDPERNATIYTGSRKNSTGTSEKCVYYQIETDTKTMYIREVYYDGATSPFHILCEWVENGIYCKARLVGVPGYPPIEWLSQFGIKKFEG